MSLNLFVGLDVDETKHQSVGAAFEFFADLENPGGHFSWSKCLCEQHRIKTPDESFWSDQRGQLLEGLNSTLNRWDVRLKIFLLIVIQCELKIVMNPAASSSGRYRIKGFGFLLQKTMTFVFSKET